MSRNGARNARLRAEHLPTIKDFCADHDLEYEFVNGYEWHVRIEKVIDVYPTRNKWHWLPTGERGQFKDYDDLGRIFMERMDDES